jgi:hypothetical protein
MVTETEYIKALRIVETYHEQIGLTGTASRKTIFDLAPGDRIKCVKVKRDNMAETLTKGNTYTILSRKDNYIWIRDDKGRSKRYDLSIECWTTAD